MPDNLTLLGVGGGAGTFWRGMQLSYVDDDTISISAGALLVSGSIYQIVAPATITFANIDTGVRTMGTDYYVYAVSNSSVISFVISASPSYPNGYSAATSRLLGYFHNGAKADGTVGANRSQAIFKYSVCSNDLIVPATPYIAHPDLPAGVPLPGMVKCGNFAIGIYAAARADATGSAAGSSVVPRSHYGVVPWVSIPGFEANAVAAAAGCRLPTLHEWWMAAMFNPGSATLVALQNGNTNSGASSDDATQSGVADPTQAGGTLVGTGPRTSNWANASGRSWYSPIGCSDMVGNVGEWVAHLAAGLYSTAGYGAFQDWGYGDGDGIWNVASYTYQPQKGGWTAGLPSMAKNGGNHRDTVKAGVRTVVLNSAPGSFDTFTGFRLAR